MVEVDPTTKLIGADGPVPLIDIFDGRSQLIADLLMWQRQARRGAVRGLHLQSRDVSYATFCQGPYEESSRYRDFMGWTVPWYSVPEDSVDALVADPVSEVR